MVSKYGKKSGKEDWWNNTKKDCMVWRGKYCLEYIIVPYSYSMRRERAPANFLNNSTSKKTLRKYITFVVSAMYE